MRTPLSIPTVDWSRIASWLGLRAGEVESFSNRLTEPRAARRPLPRAWRLLAALLVIALLPRLAMAWRIPTLCVDGTTYVQLAEACERGEMNLGSVYRLNLYPPILAALHKLGCSWEFAGKLWGVACGTLVVLPLFGWVRRQFDDRVAAVSCFLYAVHSELIEWTPELVRDQTFWLLFTASLYFIWRAVTELRLRDFAAVGVVVPLAALTRFEAVFLLIPYLFWTIVRYRSLEIGRSRLVAGILISLVAPPAALGAVNAVWLKQDSLRRLPYVEPLKRVATWWNNVTNSPESTPTFVPGSQTKPISARLALRYLQTMERGLKSFYGLLMFGGLFAYWRFFSRSDHLPTVFYAAAVAAGIWIHLWYAGDASSRYCLSIVILSSRTAAVGLMRAVGIVVETATRREASSVRLVTATLALPMFFFAVGWYSTFTTRFDSRVAKAELGRWIRNECGEHCVVAGVDQQLALVGYYANAVTRPLSANGAPDSLVAQIEQAGADVVVVARPPLTADEFEAVQACRDRLEFREVAPSEHPAGAVEVLLSTRPRNLR